MIGTYGWIIEGRTKSDSMCIDINLSGSEGTQRRDSSVPVGRSG